MTEAPTEKETEAAKEAITAMVDAICEVTEVSPLGFAPEGEIYAGLLPAMPNMSADDFRRLVLMACATGRVKKGLAAHTLEPV